MLSMYFNGCLFVICIQCFQSGRDAEEKEKKNTATSKVKLIYRHVHFLLHLREKLTKL